MRKVLTGCIFLLCITVFLVGCGGTNNSSNDISTPQVEEKKLKVAFLFDGPINDGAWVSVAYTALKNIEKNHGAEISYAENLAQSDMEEMLRHYAAAGFDIIYGHGFNFLDPAKKVAPEYPDLKFIVGSAYDCQEPNLIGFETDNFQMGFMCGGAAAMLSKREKVGIVGAVEIPAIADTLKGFEAGAKYVKPGIIVMSAYTGDFTDVAKVKEAAIAMVENGADVVMGQAGSASTGAIEAAEQYGVYAIGVNADQNELAPDTVVTSGINDMTVGIELMINDIINDKFEIKPYRMGAKEGAVYMAPFHGFEEKLDKALLAQMQQLFDDVKSGKIDTSALNK